MSDIQYKIVKQLGMISTSKKGQNKELNLIPWNVRELKYDIREWPPEHDKMGKEITLMEEGAKALLSQLWLLVDVDNEESVKEETNGIEAENQKQPLGCICSTASVWLYKHDEENRRY